MIEVILLVKEAQEVATDGSSLAAATLILSMPMTAGSSNLSYVLAAAAASAAWAAGGNTCAVSAGACALVQEEWQPPELW